MERLTMDKIKSMTGKNESELRPIFNSHGIIFEARGTTVVSGEETRAMRVVNEYLM